MENFKIAVSKFELKSKIPARDPLWPKFNASFENEELDTHAIMDCVYNGNAITTWHKNHWRTVEIISADRASGLISTRKMSAPR
jgi:hypothetical protein